MTLSVGVLFGQNNKEDQSRNHEKMKAKKVAYITDELELTPSESAKFWPIYNEFKKAFDELHDERHSYDSLVDVTDVEAKDILNKSIQRDKKEIVIKEKYYAQFLEAIPAKKLVRLRSVERKFRKEVLYSIRDKYHTSKN